RPPLGAAPIQPGPALRVAPPAPEPVAASPEEPMPIPVAVGITEPPLAEPLPVHAPEPVAVPSPAPAEVELAELVVSPVRGPATRPAGRRSPLPAIAATVVGLAGLAGLAYFFTRGGPPAPTATAPV